MIFPNALHHETHPHPPHAPGARDAHHAAEPQDIEWNTAQFIANSRQPAEGMMYPGEIRLVGPRTMQAGEPLRCGLRAVPPAVPTSYHGVYRKVELRPELKDSPANAFRERAPR